LALPAVAVYVLHHSLAKGALFMGVGVVHAVGTSFWRLRVAVAGMVLAALALAGAPLTSGAVAKTALKDATHTAHAPWADLLLTLSALATTLLMVRFLLLIRAELAGEDSPKPFQLWIWLPWTVLVLSIVTVGWLLPWYVDLGVASPADLTLAKLWSGVWPVLAGVALFGVPSYVARQRDVHLPFRIPAGDLIVPIEAVLAGLPDRFGISSDIQSPRRVVVGIFHDRKPPLRRIESGMARWGNAGMLLMSLLIVFLLLLAL
jgi:NADH:ubiquinone oxidoreductase subunit 5 (subunit L)/multisubunit Na+/H+ antiporter MnhA subunit